MKRSSAFIIFIILIATGIIFVATNNDSLNSIIYNGFSPKKDDNTKASVAVDDINTPPKGVYVNYMNAYSKFNTIEYDKILDSKYYDSIELTNEHDKLDNETQRDCYSLIDDVVYRVSNKPGYNNYYEIEKFIILNETTSEADIKKAMYAYQNDHPEVFWLANIFGFSHNENGTVVQLYSVYSKDNCTGLIKKFNLTVNSIIDEVESGLAQFERELYVHNWIMSNCSYDDNASDDIKQTNAFNSFGAIVQGKAVCEGYSRATQLLLSKLGINSRLVNGVSKDIPHMWNIVNIDGDWYHLDVTWDDSMNMNRYDYFNLTDDLINLDHQIYKDYKQLSYDEINDNSSPAQFNLSLPVCNSMKANYFEVKAVKIFSLDKNSDNEVISKLVQAMEDNEEDISIKISNNMDYFSTIEKMFSKPPYKFIYYADKANELTSNGIKIDTSKIIYAEAEEQNSLTIKLNFRL